MAAPDRHALVIASIFSILFFASVTPYARSRPIWHDEVVTLVVAGQPTLGAVRAALGDGVDLQPPLNTLLTRAVFGLAGQGPVQTRLTATIGVWVGCLALFEIVRRRSHVWLGLAAAIIPCQSAVFRFAYEGRGYGLLFGASALALFFWSEAAGAGRRRWHLVALAIALGTSLWAHYYAVLLWVPLLSAEAVRQIRNRRADLPMLAALATGAALVLPLIPLAREALGHASTFWAQSADHQLWPVYAFALGALFDPYILWGAGIAAGLAAAAAIGRLPQRATAPLPAYEIVCGLLLLAIPMMGIALGAVAGGFTPRYGLVVVAGLAVVAPIAAWRATRGVIRVDLAVALTMVIAFGGTVRYAWSSERPPFQHPYETRPALGAELEAGRAVAVTGGLTFAQLWYYAPPALRPSLFFVADPESARRQSGSDTIDTGLIALSHWAPVNVLGYREFLDAHREFSVYAFGSGWLIARLEADDIPLVAEVSGDPGARLLRAIGR